MKIASRFLCLSLLLGCCFSIHAASKDEPMCPVLQTINDEGAAFFSTVLGLDWQSKDYNVNGMNESWEVALVASVLCDDTLAYHTELRALYQANLATLRTEADYATKVASYENVLVALMLTSQNMVNKLVETLTLTGSYSAFRPEKSIHEPFSWAGDYDNDGSLNQCEYRRAFNEEGTYANYVAYATNPTQAGETGCNPLSPPEFCTYLDLIADQGSLLGFIVGYRDLWPLVACDVADLNGGINEETNLPQGNGMMDVPCELALIKTILSDSSFDLSSGTLPGQVQPGATYDMTLDAMNTNRYQIYQEVGERALKTLDTFGLSQLAEGLFQLFSAYTIFGDDDSIETVNYLYGTIEKFVANPNLDMNDFILLPEFFSPAGDADGDGYTNTEEYNEYFDESDPTIYVNAALNPAINPGGVVEGEGEGTAEGEGEGTVEGEGEGTAEGEGEGTVEGEGEGAVEGEGEGTVEGEGEGTVEDEGEGAVEGEGEGTVEGEGEGTVEGEGEGAVEGEGEGTVEGEGEGDHGLHSGDQNGDNRINLSELLRLIQFFNTNEYHCAGSTEDGYAPGTGDTSCTLHASDYKLPEWKIGLSELLRFIQFFNSAGYHACDGSEDGFCVGVPTK